MFEGIVEGLEGMGGWALGLGALVIAGPALARGMRPTAKGAIKGYLALTDRARSASQETRENLEELMSEARAEYRTEVQTPGA